MISSISTKPTNANNCTIPFSAHVPSGQMNENITKILAITYKRINILHKVKVIDLPWKKYVNANQNK